MDAPLFLIRTDPKEEYLQDLQKGKLYMNPGMRYQTMEEDDKARKDIYDGSLPDSGKYLQIVPPPEIRPTKNPRYTLSNTYIKCFHQYSASDVHRVDEHTWSFMFSEETRSSIRAFNSKYAMIVFGNRFIHQFEQACEEKGLTSGHGSVCYMNEEQYAAYEKILKQYIIDGQQGKQSPSPQLYLPFCKPDEYHAQQEYRALLFYESEEVRKLKGNSPVTYLNKEEQKVFQQPFILDIGSLEDCSIIVPISAILDNPLYIRLFEDGKIEINLSRN